MADRLSIDDGADKVTELSGDKVMPDQLRDLCPCHLMESQIRRCIRLEDNAIEAILLIGEITRSTK